MHAFIEEIPSPQNKPTRCIELRGVRVHNLKGIDLDIPLGQLVVISGVSGSGKSSLAFDTLFAEGQRRYIESFSSSARQYLERIERPNADRIAHVPPAVAIRSESGRRLTFWRTTVASLIEVDESLRRLFAKVGRVICSDCGIEVRSHTVADVVQYVNSLPEGTRFQLCFRPGEIALTGETSWRSRGFTRAIMGDKSVSIDADSHPSTLDECWLVVDRLVSGKATLERITESAETAFHEGNGHCILLSQGSSHPQREIDGHAWGIQEFNRQWNCDRCGLEFLPPAPNLFVADSNGGCPSCRDQISGQATSECAVCLGSRMRPEAMAVRIGEFSIADVLRSSILDALELSAALTKYLTEPELTLTQLIREDIKQRLEIASRLRLGHFILNRSGDSLSGGETRRLMLAAALGSRITGTLCVIDEPSAGLHPTEFESVISALRQLRDLRNSVIVVDHAPEVVEAADHVIELGPGAGMAGGAVIYEGKPIRLRDTEQSAMGRILRERGLLPESPRSKREPSDWLTLTNVSHHNFKRAVLQIPLGVLCVVCGCGGSGKTSLVVESLYPALRSRRDGLAVAPTSAGYIEQIEGGDSLMEVTLIDQSPLTRSPRGNAATWIEAFDGIREVFAMSAEAKQRGFGPQHFSFNATSGGRCRSCRGTGILRHDMQFLPDVTLTCPECGGTRYRREILDVKYRGRSIADVLAMSASEAAFFFRNHPRLQARLHMLKQIGLDYLVLGQPTDTLSGGEAQRLKFASRLSSGRGQTLIICDEATAGLHPLDVKRLVACFDELLAVGHSLLVVDNSPELIQAADHVISLG